MAEDFESGNQERRKWDFGGEEVFDRINRLPQ
jgi:hypothetical protein